MSAHVTAEPKAPGSTRFLILATDAHGGLGGIAQYNKDVIESLCSLSAVSEVYVLTRGPQITDLATPPKARYDRRSGRSLGIFVLRAMLKGLFTRRLSAVYCAHLNLLPVAAVIAILRRRPLILAIYGIDAWNEPDSPIYGVFLRFVSLTLSISKITLDRFCEWSDVPRQKCAILPNALHLAQFGIGPKDNALARRLGVEGRPVISTFGRMSDNERYKGFDEVIQLMPRLVQRVPGLVYVAAGDGSDRERLEAKSREMGLNGHVIFTGKLSETERLDLYRLSDAYVMPSSGEGFGFVVLEALATGAPVVASSVDGTKEAVREGKLGLLVDPRNDVALEQAVLDSLQKPRRVPSGLEYFSFENFGIRLSAALSRVVPALRT